jgi:glycosyltransferase involved in cell wall biosynthesis
MLADLDRTLHEAGIRARVVLVDDGSTTPCPAGLFDKGFAAFDRLTVLELRRNLGHQRAIAVGLVYVHMNIPTLPVAVMDGDGEDSPKDVPRLLRRYREQNGERVIFAERTKRSEGTLFKVFYFLYRRTHLLLTGKRIRVGNFSIMPARQLARLVVVSELWNHYAASVFKARLPWDSLPTVRADRTFGRSQMNFVSLVVHGLSAISVYGDVVGVRLLVGTAALILLAIAGLAVTVGIRLFTELAIPGWATFTTGFFLLVLMQATTLCLFFVFATLSGRQGATVIPLRDCPIFVLSEWEAIATHDRIHVHRL